MTRRERVAAAIRHEDTDFVPYSLSFTIPEHERVATQLGDPQFEAGIYNHIRGAYYEGYSTETPPGSGYWRDDFGVVWNRTGPDKDIGVIDQFQLTEPDLRRYRFPVLDEPRWRADLAALTATKDDTFKMADIGFSLFERAWTLRGMENLLADMVENPGFVDELLEAITVYNLRVIDIALEYPVDGFLFGDDWGMQRGLIMGREYWQRFVKPHQAKMYARAKAGGRFVFQHSCGDIRALFPDLIEIGLDVYQTFQPEIYDLRETKRTVGQNLSFWGGISTQNLLPRATPAEVRRVTRETLAIMGAGGGYIAAPTHAIPGDVPPENVLAMIAELASQPGHPRMR